MSEEPNIVNCGYDPRKPGPKSLNILAAHCPEQIATAASRVNQIRDGIREKEEAERRAAAELVYDAGLKEMVEDGKVFDDAKFVAWYEAVELLGRTLIVVDQAKRKYAELHPDTAPMI